KILIERNVGVVEERLLDCTNRTAGHIDVFVDEIRVVAQLTPEEPHWFVTAPAAVAYLLAEEVIAARHPVRARVVGPGHDLSDLCCKLRCTALVGIQDEDPRAPRTLDPTISRRADGGEFRADHRRASCSRPINRI